MERLDSFENTLPNLAIIASSNALSANKQSINEKILYIYFDNFIRL
jgi:hypothetical protein